MIVREVKENRFVTVNEIHSNTSLPQISEATVRRRIKESNLLSLLFEKCEDNGVEKMVWPSQSSDLNPIENLWSYMDTSGLTWTGGFENARAIMLMRCFKSCKAR